MTQNNLITVSFLSFVNGECEFDIRCANTGRTVSLKVDGTGLTEDNKAFLFDIAAPCVHTYYEEVPWEEIKRRNKTDTPTP